MARERGQKHRRHQDCASRAESIEARAILSMTRACKGGTCAGMRAADPSHDPPHIRPFPRPLIHSPTCAAAKGSSHRDVHLFHVRSRSFSEVVTVYKHERHERWSVAQVRRDPAPPFVKLAGAEEEEGRPL